MAENHINRSYFHSCAASIHPTDADILIWAHGEYVYIACRAKENERTLSQYTIWQLACIYTNIHAYTIKQLAETAREYVYIDICVLLSTLNTIVCQFSLILSCVQQYVREPNCIWIYLNIYNHFDISTHSRIILFHIWTLFWYCTAVRFQWCVIFLP